MPLPLPLVALVALAAASEPPLGIPPAFWPALAIGVLVGGAFIRGWVVPGPMVTKLLEQQEARTAAAEARAVAAEQANLAAIPALDRSQATQDKMLDYLAEQERLARAKGAG